MEPYLMMLYVTLEQEKSLKSFFSANGWDFSKPDLSTITDKLGPLKPTHTKPQGIELPADSSQDATQSAPNVERPFRSAVKRRLQSMPITSAQKPKVAKVEHVCIGTSDRADEDREKKVTVKVIMGKNLDGTDLPVEEGSKEDEPIKVETVDLCHDYAEDEDIEDLNDDGDNDDDFAVESESENTPKMGMIEDYSDVLELDESSLVEGENILDGETEIETEKMRRMTRLSQGPQPVHSCSVCKMKCKSITLLKRHMERHGPDYQVCGTCGFQVTSEEALQEHLKVHSTKVKCGKCGEYVEQLQQHLETCKQESDGPPTCKKCKKRFSKMKELDLHVAACKVGPFMCNVCGIVCRRISSLNRHKLRHDPDGGRYPCDYCGRRFFQRYDMLEHVLIHQPKVECHACGKLVSNLKGHMKLCRKALAEKSLIRCRKCEKVFASLEAKEEHMQECKSDVFTCEICNITYTTLGSLRLHHKKQHENIEGDFVCKHCGQRFFGKYKLLEHEHLHRPKVLCKQCGKMVHPTKRHERLCRSPKIHHCDYCNSPIRGSVSHLKRHIQRHHMQEASMVEDEQKCQSAELKKKKIYACHKCGETFMYKGWQEAHERECKGFGLARTEEVYQSGAENLPGTASDEQTTAEEVEVAMMLPSVVEGGEIGSETMLTDLATNTVYIIKH